MIFNEIHCYFFTKGAACNNCNLNRANARHIRKSFFVFFLPHFLNFYFFCFLFFLGIPLFCHNFYNYDCQFLLNTGLNDRRIHYSKCIPASTEKLKCLFLNRFDFRDSLAFLPGSLDACVKDLVKRGKGFPHLRQSEILLDDDSGQFCDEKYALLTKAKGVFPYEFLDHTDKLYQTGKTHLFSCLNKSFLFCFFSRPATY